MMEGAVDVTSIHYVLASYWVAASIYHGDPVEMNRGGTLLHLAM